MFQNRSLFEEWLLASGESILPILERRNTKQKLTTNKICFFVYLFGICLLEEPQEWFVQEEVRSKRTRCCSSCFSKNPKNRFFPSKKNKQQLTTNMVCLKQETRNQGPGTRFFSRKADLFQPGIRPGLFRKKKTRNLVLFDLVLFDHVVSC